MSGPLRLLVVGCGRVFRRFHLPALRHAEGIEVAGVADRDAGAARAAADALGGVPAFAEAEELLTAVPAAAALVLTPPDTHAPVIDQALARGLHLLVEKPLATEVAAAERLAAAARARGLWLQVGYNRRLRPSLRALAAALGEGGSGPRRLRLRLRTPGGRWGRASGDERAVARELLFDLGTHLADLAAWLAGSPVVAVRAKPLRFPGGGPELAAEFRLADGSRAYCTVGYGRRLEEHAIVQAPDGLMVATPWTFHRGGWTAGTGLRDRLRRLADLGSARLGLTRNLTQRSFDAQLAGFHEAVAGRPRPELADARAAVAAVRTVEAWRRSLAAAGDWCDAHRDDASSREAACPLSS